MAKAKITALGILSILILSASAIAAVISQGYTAEGKLSPGMIVSPVLGENRKVIAADTEQQNVFGVVVGDQNSILETKSGQDNVQIATEGLADVLVSDLSGKIAAGDPITFSPIKGVGAKATFSTRIIGFAVENFDDVETTAASHSVTATDGSNTQVTIKSVKVTIRAGFQEVQSSSLVPSSVQQFANAVAGGGEVSIVRIVIAGGLSVLGTIIVAIIVVGAVQSTLISIGRNPLAKKEIYAGMYRTVGLSLLMLVLAYGLSVFFLRF